MKNLILLVFAVVLTAGCSAPVGFDGPADWVRDLSSEVAQSSDKKIRNGKKQVKRRKVKPVSDVVTAQPPPPPVSAAPPAFVQELKKQVNMHKVDKHSGHVSEGADLVGDASPRPAVSPPLVEASSGTGKVDIVFIVDSSNSMNPFLEDVPQTFAGFVPALSSLDWQMMFTNAEYGGLFGRQSRAMPLEDNGKSLWHTRYLTKNTAKSESIFLDTLRLQGTFEYMDERGEREISPCTLSPGCQGWNEQPLKALKYSFAKNRSFFRPGADVAAIIFSDSDEGEHTQPEERTKVKEVLQAFQEQWGTDGKTLKVYGIIMRPEVDALCLKKHSKGFLAYGEGVFGTELLKMVEMTGGADFGLCENTYVPLAKKIVVDFQK